MSGPIIIGKSVRKRKFEFYGLEIPGGGGILVSGPEKVGKTSIVLSIASRIAQQTGSFLFIANEERQDEEYLLSICTRYIPSERIIILNEPVQTSRKIIQEWGEKGAIFVVDSIAAITGMRETEAKHYGEGNFGERAKIVNELVRHLAVLSSRTLLPFFLVNHRYPSVGGVGSITPGGHGKDYLVELSLVISPVYNRLKSGKEVWEDADRKVWAVNAKIDSSRYSSRKENSPLVVEGGCGISVIKTAIYLLIDAGVWKCEKGRVYDQKDNFMGMLSDLMLSSEEDLSEIAQRDEIKPLLIEEKT